MPNLIQHPMQRIALILASAILMAACAGGAGAAPADPDPGFVVRGTYGHDSSYDTTKGSTSGFSIMQAKGFNTVQTGPYKEGLDALAAAGLKGIVWLGGFDNTQCAFRDDDATIRSKLAPIAGHAAIEAYYIADEPHVSQCPNAPSLLKARTELIHSLDPGSKTFTVLQRSETGFGQPYRSWAGTGAADIFGFDVYPCTRTPYRCDFSKIDQDRATIESLGFSPYWAVLQDFQDCYYGLPSNDDLRTQFQHWQQSKMAGYLVFSWNFSSSVPGCAQYSVPLETAPGNVDELGCENRQPIGADAAAAGC